MNAIDWLIIAYVGLGLVVGFFKGFVAQLLHSLTIVAATIITFLLFPHLGSWVSASLHVPDAYGQPVSLAIIFTAALLALRFITPFVEKILGSIANANPVNRLGGAALGGAANLLVTSIAVAIITVLPLPDSVQKSVSRSKLAPPLTTFAFALDRALGQWGHLPGINLGFQVDGGNDTTEPLNFTSTNPTEDIEGEVKLLVLINELRSKKKATTLTPDIALQTAARSHAKDMLAKGYFGHKSPDGVLAGGRLHQAGLDPKAFGENLAKAQTVELAQAGLLASPGHLKIMLDPVYDHVGIAVFDSGSNGKIVVELFAKLN